MISLPPLLRLLLPLAVGIVAGEVCFDLFEGIAAYLWGVVVVGLGLSLWGQRQQGAFAARWQGVGLSLLVAVLGIIFIRSERQTTFHLWPSEATTYRAVVSEPPRRTEKGWRARLRLTDAPHRDREVELLLVDSTRRLQVGTPVVFHTRLRSPRNLGNPSEMDYAAYLRRQGVVGTGVAFSSEWDTLSHTLPLTLRVRALQVREQAMAHYRMAFGDHELAVLSAITLGNRSLLDRETRQLYSQTGASHVLALSGLHLAILYYFYQMLVGRLLLRRGRWRWIAPLLGIAWIWAFAFWVGFPTSLVRASLMFSFALIFEWFEHTAKSFHRLLLAALLMLLIHPYWLFDLGFQLSYVAVAGIVLLRPTFPVPQFLIFRTRRERMDMNMALLTPFQEHLQRWGRGFYDFLCVSFAAQLATAPLVAYHFHLIPWSGLLGNLGVIPAVYLLLSGAFLFLVLPFARTLLAVCISGVLNVMEGSLRFLSQLPLTTTAVYPSEVTVIMVYVVLIAWAWNGKHSQEEYYFYLPPAIRWKALRKLALVVVVILAIDLALVPIAPSSLRVYNVSRGTHLHLTLPDRQSLLLASDTLQVRQSLSQSAAHDWARRHLSVTFCPLKWLNDAEGCERLQQKLIETMPLAADTSTTTSSYFACAPRIILLGKLRCAVVQERLSYAFPATPLPVDFLLLGDKASQSLEHTFRFFQPRQIILSAGLSSYRRQRFRDEAEHWGIAVFDVSEEGMFEAMVQ